MNVTVIRYNFSKHLYMYTRLIRLSVSVDLSSHKESDLRTNDWQAAANMLEQRNKQRNSLGLIMTDLFVIDRPVFLRLFVKVKELITYYVVSSRYNENIVV